MNICRRRYMLVYHWYVDNIWIAVLMTRSWGLCCMARRFHKISKLTGEYVKTSNLGRNGIEYCLQSIYPRGPITETEKGNGTPSYSAFRMWLDITIISWEYYWMPRDSSYITQIFLHANCKMPLNCSIPGVRMIQRFNLLKSCCQQIIIFVGWIYRSMCSVYTLHTFVHISCCCG